MARSVFHIKYSQPVNSGWSNVFEDICVGTYHNYEQAEKVAMRMASDKPGREFHIVETRATFKATQHVTVSVAKVN